MHPSLTVEFDAAVISIFIEDFDFLRVRERLTDFFIYCSLFTTTSIIIATISP